MSTNPILGFLALFLILAWRIGGYYGLDRYVLPLLGTPWTGRLVGEQTMPETTPLKPSLVGDKSRATARTL